MIRYFHALLVILGLAFDLSAATKSLDQGRVRQLYKEGDFDGILDLIGRFRSEHSAYSRDDSICIAKHLAVVYAANPRSVGHAKYWMNELLKLRPNADFMGMYVGDRIDRIFEKVRAEFLVRQHSLGVDTTGLVHPSPPVPEGEGAGKNASRSGSHAPGGFKAGPEPVAEHAPGSPATVAGQNAGNPEDRRARRTYWILGGTAAAAATGVTAYFLINSSREAKPTEFVVPQDPSE